MEPHKEVHAGKFHDFACSNTYPSPPGVVTTCHYSFLYGSTLHLSFLSDSRIYTFFPSIYHLPASIPISSSPFPTKLICQSTTFHPYPSITCLLLPQPPPPPTFIPFTLSIPMNGLDPRHQLSISLHDAA